MKVKSLGRCITFDNFALYPEAGRLHKRGVPLKPVRPMQVAFLTMLVERAGTKVTKQEIESRLWPNEGSTKNRLNVLASNTWKALGDTNRMQRKYFTALGREGYCFVCPLTSITKREHGALSDLESEDAYRAGRHYLENRQESSLREAVASFKRAIDYNPSHVLAWVGLADSYIMMGIHCVCHPAEAFLKACAAAAEALQIAPSTPEAKASLAWIALCHDRDWSTAKAGFVQALEENPEYFFAHNGRALLQLVTGHAEDTIASIEKARQFSPLSPPLSALLCHSLYLARRYKDAAEAGLKAVVSDPESCIAHASLGHALLQINQQQEALLHFDEARRLSKNSKVYLGFWAYACGIAGFRAEAEAALQKLSSIPSYEYVPSYFVGLIHLGLGRSEECIPWLNRACDEHSHWVLFLNADPMFDGIRSQPLFRDLLQKVGLSGIPRLTNDRLKP